MLGHRLLVGLAALSLPACLEDRRPGLTDTASAPDAAPTDAPAPATSGTVRLSARLLGPLRDEACIDLAVSDGQTTLWRQGDPSTTRSGADQRLAPRDRVAGRLSPDEGATCHGPFTFGESATFVLEAPCDATRDADPGRPGVQNTLTLWIDDVDLYAPERALMPCPDGCTLAFDCVAGHTTELAFDGAIVHRGGGAGFADTSDLFDAAHCAAKYDSCLELLQDDAGQRVETSIVALACGSGGPDLFIELGPVAVSCETRRFELQPVKLGPDAVWSKSARLGFSTFFGKEEFGTDAFRTYYNLALRTADLFELGEDCHLEWSGTSHALGRAIFEGPRPAADGLVYPFFTIRVPLTRAGEPVCEVSTLDDRRLMDSELRGTTGGHEPLLPHCFHTDGEAAAATGAPGCTGP